MQDSQKIVNPQGMIEAGYSFAATLKSGNIIALIGELGAGKTHFTKGILAGLGYKEEVTSPTFTLVHEYLGGNLPVFHFDLYRLEQEEELLAIGWDDFFDRQGVIIVEWADRFPELFPDETHWVSIQHSGEERILEYNTVKP